MFDLCLILSCACICIHVEHLLLMGHVLPPVANKSGEGITKGRPARGSRSQLFLFFDIYILQFHCISIGNRHFLPRLDVDKATEEGWCFLVKIATSYSSLLAFSQEIELYHRSLGQNTINIFLEDFSA